MRINGNYVIETNPGQTTSYFNVSVCLHTAQDADDLIAALKLFKLILKDIAGK